MHTPIPINITAAGKIICAQLSAEEQQDLLNHETPSTKNPPILSVASALFCKISKAPGKKAMLRTSRNIPEASAVSPLRF